MKRRLLLISFIFQCVIHLYSQELFLMTDPASTLPEGAFTINFLNKINSFENSDQLYIPELSYGLTKKTTLRGSLFFTPHSPSLNGASLMTKIRIISSDDANNHYRIACFGRVSYLNHIYKENKIEIFGNNSGYELGIIQTKLVEKLAINGVLSFEQKISDNFNNEKNNSALNFSLSFGRLIYPKKYTNFKETNINLMFEVIGQKPLRKSEFNLNFTPIIQFIFNSQSRIDIAYQREINSITRIKNNYLIFNFYHIIF
jgi:hypothetical protein